jgi:hypothetical protein
MHTCAYLSPPATAPLNDLYRFSAGDNTWTALSPTGSGPTPRDSMGFAATPDGMLYVFGGDGGSGKEGKKGGGGRGKHHILENTTFNFEYTPFQDLL